MLQLTKLPKHSSLPSPETVINNQILHYNKQLQQPRLPQQTVVAPEGHAGYRPPLAPKPNHVYPQQQNVRCDGADTLNSTVFISHGKSDSVDSSDGLRSSSKNSQMQMNNVVNEMDSKRASSSRVIANENINNYERDPRRSDRGAFSSNLSHGAAARSGNDQVINSAGPTPPPRAYKIVCAKSPHGNTNEPYLVLEATTPSIPGRQVSPSGRESQQSLSYNPAMSSAAAGSPVVHPADNREMFAVPQVPVRSASSHRSSTTRQHTALINRHLEGSRSVLHHAGQGITSAPGSRYGSSSSINNADGSPLGAIDYRVNLGSVRVALDESDDNQSMYGSQLLKQSLLKQHNQRKDSPSALSHRSYRDSILSENGTSDFLNRTNQSSMSRAPSIRSLRCDSPAGNNSSRASIGSAKNALLKERVLGTMNSRISDSSASPVLPRDSTLSSRFKKALNETQDSNYSSRDPSLDARRSVLNSPAAANRNSDYSATLNSSPHSAINRLSRKDYESNYGKPNLSARRQNPVSSNSAIHVNSDNSHDVRRNVDLNASPSKVSAIVSTFDAAIENKQQQRTGNVSSVSARNSRSTSSVAPENSGSSHRYPGAGIDSSNLLQPPLIPTLQDHRNKSQLQHLPSLESRQPLTPPSSAISGKSVSKLPDSMPINTEDNLKFTKTLHSSKSVKRAVHPPVVGGRTGDHLPQFDGKQESTGGRILHSGDPLIIVVDSSSSGDSGIDSSSTTSPPANATAEIAVATASKGVESPRSGGEVATDVVDSGATPATAQVLLQVQQHQPILTDTSSHERILTRPSQQPVTAATTVAADKSTFVVESGATNRHGQHTPPRADDMETREYRLPVLLFLS